MTAASAAAAAALAVLAVACVALWVRRSRRRQAEQRARLYEGASSSSEGASATVCAVDGVRGSAALPDDWQELSAVHGALPVAAPQASAGKV